ncbi:hypothetical protein [Thalassoglobus sp.]|uniref:hypothetical protein n=1 Tax=Thalassoglobus sp. TaxID=2795869 RepID=UPI003AA93C80
MRYAKLFATTSFLATFAIITQLKAQELAPAPPAVEAIPETEINDVSVPAPMPLPVSAGEGTEVPSGEYNEAFDATYSGEYCDTGATCCDTSAACCDANAYRCCCCGHEGCYMPGIHYRTKSGKLKWCRVWTTGDMYQHYAYYPAHHGYYYYRPYNYTNVLEHKEVIVRLGGERNHPYSVALFEPIYDNYYLTNPKIVEETPTMDMIPGASLLPNLEELLQN